MAVLLTGGAGFIAAALIGPLLSTGKMVISVDNLSRGSLDNIKSWLGHPRFAFVRAELNDFRSYRLAVLSFARHNPITEVWHLAANSDIPAGVRDPDVDLQHTFMTTFNTLKIMEECGVHQIFFASSSAIYGDLQNTLLTEVTGPLFPISNYGAMKLASEATITAAAEKFLNRALIFRFPNVVGAPATHGVILDFMHRLKQRPDDLEILGDGKQQKPYLHVTDLVDAMIFLRERCSAKVDAFNIGPIDDGITVSRIAEEVIAAIAPGAKLHFQSGSKAWVGDVPRFRYSTAKLQRLGWVPRLDSLGAVRRAIPEIANQVFSPMASS
jgi:UDP-glucose 4-epimerase